MPENISTGWRVVRTTYFEDEKTPLISHIVRNSIEPVAEAHPDVSFCLRTHWRRGPHVDVAVRAAEGAFFDDVYPRLEGSLTDFVRRSPSRVTLDPADYLRQSERLALMELQTGELLPLYDNNKVFLAPAEPPPGGPGGIVWDVQRNFGARCWRLLGLLADLKRADPDRFMVTLVEMLSAVGTHYSPGGLYYGHISFRAHAEYFFAMYDKKGSARAQFNTVWDRSAGSLLGRIRAIHERASVGADVFPPEDAIGALWWRAMKQTLPEIEAVAAEHATELSDESFFEKSVRGIAENVSKEAWLSDPEMSEMERIMQGARGRALRSRKEFVTYRILVNFFYALLPILSVSPLQKFCLCHMVANGCEQVFSRNWRSYLSGFEEGLAT